MSPRLRVWILESGMTPLGKEYPISSNVDS